MFRMLIAIVSLGLAAILEISKSSLWSLLLFLFAIQVVYEDADEEELEWKELEPILVPLNGSLPAASKKRSRPASVTGAKEKR
jgi:hypothetical protein